MVEIHIVQRHRVREKQVILVTREIRKLLRTIKFNRASSVGATKDSAVDIREGKGRESIAEVCIEGAAGIIEPDIAILGSVLDMFWVDFQSVLMDYWVESFHKALHCVVVVTIFYKEYILRSICHNLVLIACVARAFKARFCLQGAFCIWEKVPRLYN